MFFIFFRVSSTASTATSGVDFSPIVNQQVLFGPGATTRQITVTILTDDIVETNEVFTLTLSAGAGSPLNVGSPGTTQITINDDDGMHHSNQV
jgi:hypothetical protein